MEHERSFACAWRACEHHDRGWNHTFTADGVVDEFEADLLAVAEGVRDLDVRDVGAALETLDADVEVHFAHCVCPVFRALWVSVAVDSTSVPRWGRTLHGPPHFFASELGGVDPLDLALRVLDAGPGVELAVVFGDAGPEDLAGEAVHRDRGALGRDAGQELLGFRLEGVLLGLFLGVARSALGLLGILGGLADGSLALRLGELRLDPSLVEGLPGSQLVVDGHAAVEEEVAHGVGHRLEAVAAAVREEVGAVHPGEPVADAEGLDLRPGGVVDVVAVSAPVVAGLLALHAEVHQGVGAGRGAVVAVVQGVRPVTDLRGVLHPDDSAHVEGLGRGVAAVEVVVLLGDRHDLTISRSLETLHRTCDFSGRVGFGEELLELREVLGELLGCVLVQGPEQVAEVFLVHRELGDVEVQVPEAGVTQGGPTFTAGGDLFCVPGEFLAQVLGVADDVRREPVDVMCGSEELHVKGGPGLHLLRDVLLKGGLVLAVVLHGLSIPFLV